MQTHKLLVRSIVVLLTATTTGCNQNENKQLADMAERHSQRQAEQSKQMVELQHEVAEGTRQLVGADAKSRQEMIAAQRQLHAEHATVGQQRDALEYERREIAGHRHRDPIVATSISTIGLILACLLPLVLCWLLLCQRVEPDDDNAIAEVLLEDLVADQPLLLPQAEGRLAISSDDDEEMRCLSDDSDLEGESA